MAASTSLPLFPQLAEMSDEEKYAIIARFIPCDLCSTCTGWHPAYNETNCHCGHDTYLAIRLNELLEEKGKIEDYDYEDEDITSLKKQIFYNATDASSVPHQEVQDLKRNREETHDDEEEDEEDHIVKRNRTEAEESEEEEEEEDDEESEEEESDKESEEEESDKEDADSDSSEEDDEEDAETHPIIDENVNNTELITTPIDKKEEEEETLPLEVDHKSENEETTELKQENENDTIINGILEDVHIKENSVPDLVPSEDEVMNGVEEEEDEVSRMIKEFMVTNYTSHFHTCQQKT
ncbi:unnamed protein product [Mucor hiemalis]